MIAQWVYLLFLDEDQTKLRLNKRAIACYARLRTQVDCSFVEGSENAVALVVKLSRGELDIPGPKRYFTFMAQS